MKVSRERPRRAIDTSVAVPLLVEAIESHRSLRAWSLDFRLSLSAHALVETYSVLTRLPGDTRVDPADAVLLIDDLFDSPHSLASNAAETIHRTLAQARVAGGAAYDALVGLAAREAGLVLATRDARARPTYEAMGVTIEVLGQRTAD